jgi:hypothetical protein
MSNVDPTLPATPEVQDDPGKPLKAIVASLVALAGLLWAALEGKADSWSNMSAQEWISILVPVLLTFAGTYITPNPKVLKRRRR